MCVNSLGYIIGPYNGMRIGRFSKDHLIIASGACLISEFMVVKLKIFRHIGKKIGMVFVYTRQSDVGKKSIFHSWNHMALRYYATKCGVNEMLPFLIRITALKQNRKRWATRSRDQFWGWIMQYGMQYTEVAIQWRRQVFRLVRWNCGTEL